MRFKIILPLYLFCIPLIASSLDSLLLDLGADTTLCEGDTLFLFSNLSGDTLSYVWSTGDTTDQIMVCKPGTYTLSVFSPNTSCTDSIFINFLPKPQINIVVEEACFGDSTLFINSSLFESNATVRWDLGDGTMLDTIGDFKHAYLGNGASYDGTILIDNLNGCISSDSFKITSLLQPTALFTTNPVCIGEPTIIRNQSIDLIDTAIVFINFGDGTNLEFPLNMDYSHTYTSAQQFNVFLQVDNENGCIDTTSLSAIVFDLPQVSFTGLDDSYCPQDPIDTLIGNPSGGTFSGVNITDGLGALGFYQPSVAGVNLPVTYLFVDTNNCSNSMTVSVPEVFEGLDLEFLNSDTTYCIDDLVDTLMLNIGGGTFEGMNLSNDGDLMNNEILFTPSELGTFQVNYTLIDDDGCENRINKFLLVNPLPEVDLGNDTFITTGQVLEIGSGMNPDLIYMWSNGSTSPVLPVEFPGFYILKVTDRLTRCMNADTILVDLASNIEERVNLRDIKVFPNPASDRVNIYFAPLITSQEEISIFNAYGQKVWSNSYNLFKGLEEKISISISKFVSGVHYIYIGEVYVAKLVVSQ